MRKLIRGGGLAWSLCCSMLLHAAVLSAASHNPTSQYRPRFSDFRSALFQMRNKALQKHEQSHLLSVVLAPKPGHEVRLLQFDTELESKRSSTAYALNSVIDRKRMPDSGSLNKEAETRFDTPPVDQSSTDKASKPATDQSSFVLQDRYYEANELTSNSQPLEEIFPAIPIQEGSVAQVGFVRIKLLISGSGVVDRVEVLESNLGQPFQASVISAFQYAVFIPGEINGVQVKSQKILDVTFGLNMEELQAPKTIVEGGHLGGSL